ncbi:peptidoglycan DD-metalloendopeptidase family protein [Streptomyces achromogenes]|uniref:aggregation-promoting factor C-terminal-like domain-containing protein n=1 Tax=Streptomyces achromogenes TaxID=67255 RepID=UPI0037035E89
MAGDLDIVGSAGVDVVPVVPNFHNRLRAAVLPAADRVGEEAGRRMGDAISRHIAVNIPDAVTSGGRRARVVADREGNQVGGAFGRSVKRKLEEAFRSLPRADVRLGDTGLNADLDRLRARIQTLSGKTIGIDLDAGAALAEITDIDARLQRLAAENPNVQVRTDTAAARAALAEVQRQINDVDRDDVNVRVDVDAAGALSALRALGISIAALSAIPVVPVAAAGIGAIASAAVAAGAGVGALVLVAIPAIKGVAEAIQAKTAADKESATATDNSAAASVRAAQRALQMASAQQALTAAHRQAAQSIAQANRQVENAERALGQAAARAMEQRRQAAEAVERAERSLSDAKRQARDAEEALTQARKNAADQLAALDDRLADGALSQRDAALRVQEAQEELNSTLADPKATDLQRERARLAYDQALQAQREQAKEYRKTQEEARKARKAGVDGNADVKRATENVADAQRSVRDQVEALADAHRAAAKAEVDSAQQVADAQRALSDAVRNAADTQVKAAESIASAERGVESARLSSIDTTAKAVTKADAYRQALAKLTPAQRDLYDSIAGPKGITAAFKDWSASVQPDVLPLFTRAVDGAKNSLPGLTPLVKTSADAIRELMDRASTQLKNPFWKTFKKDIETSARPAIVGFGVTFGNVVTGMAGVIDAFLPHIDDIADRMVQSSGRFAEWGKGLKGSAEFERFLAYADEHGPLIAQTIGAIAGAVLAVGSALSPVSGPLLKTITAVATGIASVADTLPWLIQLMYAAWAVTKLWTIALAAYNLVLNANPLILIGTAIVAVVAAVIYAYKHWGAFHDVVDATWHGIATATKWAWDVVLKPVFGFIWDVIKAVGDVAVWLWRNVFVPVWNGIVTVMRWAIAIILTVLIAPIVIALQGLGLLLGWLWEDVIQPTWQAIAWLAQWLWKNYLWPFFKSFWDTIKWVGDKFSALYTVVIAPAAGWIGDAVSTLWKKFLWPFFKSFWDATKWVGDKFQSLYDDYVSPVVGYIAAGARWLYDKGIKPAFDNIKEAIGLVGEAFDAAKILIKKTWDQVAGIAARPVNFIVDMVYTKGIKAVWDKVADFVHLDHLPKAPKLLDETPKFAEGGRTSGGTPGKDSIPALLMADEYVIKRSSARKIGFGALEHMNRTGEIPKFANGGLVGGIWDWTESALDTVGDWAKTAGDLMIHPGKIWDRLIKPTMDHVKEGVGESPMGKLIAGVPKAMVGGLKDMLVDAVTGMFGDGGGGAAGQWVKPINVPYGTRFGVPGKMWSSGHHTGLDFPAATGTKIHAVDAGKVISVSGSGPYGNHMEIDHGGRLHSLYAHMSKFLAHLGQTVGQGDVIGLSGATGNVTGPHLHLEARYAGVPKDPIPYLEGIFQGSKTGKSVAAAKKFAKSQLGYFGWGPSEWPSLERLWAGESGWRWNASNPSSGAYGIPQALPGAKMATAGPDWRTNPSTQIRWGLGYIKNRFDYGSPSAAYSKWLSRSPHWYDDGGYLPPGLSLVANGTGSPEPVFTGSQWSDIRAAKGGGGPTTIQADVKVYVGDREITDIVRTEITTYDSAVATDLNNGRWVS